MRGAAPRRVQCPEGVGFSSAFGDQRARGTGRRGGRDFALRAAVGARRAAFHQLAFPRQCVGDDHGKIVEPRLPAERRPRLPAVGDDLRRIARAPRRHLDLEVDAGGALDRFDHFEDREAVAVAAIERQRLAAGTQVTQRIGMRAHEIGDVDVVADAGAVRRRIVGAENLQLRAQTERRLDGDLDQMRGILARLPAAAAGSAPATLK